MKQDMMQSTALVADIGGTNARFGLADLRTLELSHVQRFPCAKYQGLEHAALAYLQSLPERPRHGAIAVAAPVIGDTISFTNLPWSFTRAEVCRITGLEHLLVLNDFQALAFSLPDLQPHELHRIGGEDPQPLATKVVLGPGTGIGVAGLVWTGSEWMPVESEGGHISLAAHDAREFEVAERLRGGRDHLSVERVLSGPGLADLYRILAEIRGSEPEPLVPNDVLLRGRGKTDPIAEEALTMFVTWLGGFAGDVALLFGARGGVHLGGGIAPNILDVLESGAFRQAFEAKGRMQRYLAPIPVYCILTDFATLRGAAAGLRAELGIGSAAG